MHDCIQFLCPVSSLRSHSRSRNSQNCCRSPTRRSRLRAIYLPPLRWYCRSSWAPSSIVQKKSTGRFPTHTLNDLVYNDVASPSPASLQCSSCSPVPVGLSRGDGRRPGRLMTFPINPLTCGGGGRSAHPVVFLICTKNRLR